MIARNAETQNPSNVAFHFDMGKQDAEEECILSCLSASAAGERLIGESMNSYLIGTFGLPTRQRSDLWSFRAINSELTGIEDPSISGEANLTMALPF